MKYLSYRQTVSNQLAQGYTEVTLKAAVVRTGKAYSDLRVLTVS